jgi:serine/threonine protein phosphatase 1
MRTLVTADIHGGFKSLLQCFERSKFDYNNDELIVLGDVVDGWPETRQCIDELLKVKNLIYIIGNHDMWAYNWSRHGDKELLWISQGGWNTLKSYDFEPLPEEHMKLFENANIWLEDEERNMIFCHGGFNPSVPIEKQKPDDIMWDRNLIRHARFKETQARCRSYDTNTEFVRPSITNYSEIFIGHTPVCNMTEDCKPAHFCNLWDIDTGSGWEGKLTIMDIDTKEYWQSEYVHTFYPEDGGRREFNPHGSDVIAWLHGADKGP